MTVQVGTTDSEEVTPIVLDRIRSVHRRRPRRPSSLHTTIVKPTPVEDFLFRDILTRRPRLISGRYPVRLAIETVTRCLGGGWLVKDHFRTNVRRPLCVSWGKAALSDTLNTNGRTTPDRRVVSGFH